ncbi:MAG: hypothetical protein AAF723_05905 [Pseudomonadota bacterium]
MSALFIAVSSSACVHVGAGLPDEWTVVEGSNSCPQINGVYSNVGKSNPNDTIFTSYDDETQTFSDVGIRLTHTSRFIGKGSKWYGEAYHIERVTISQSNKKLVFSFDSDKDLAPETIDYKECKNGWIILPTQNRMTGKDGDPVVGYGYSQESLAVAEDGALIRRSSGGTAGMAFLLVPMIGTELIYHRFDCLQ